MLVRELLERLEKVDPDLEVKLHYYEEDLCTFEVESAEVVEILEYHPEEASEAF